MTITTAAAAVTSPPLDFHASLAAASAPGINAEQGLQAARRAAATARQAHEQAMAGAWICTFLMRLGRHADLLDEASRVLPQLVGPELAAQRHELLRCITLCGSEIGAFDVALDAAQELARDSRTAGDGEARLTASYGLAVCLERMGDSWQAQRLLREALAGHEQSAPSRPLLVAANGVCAMAIGMAHRLRDAGADADLQDALHSGREHGELALRLLEQVPDPVYEVAVPGNLGEARLLQGDVPQAWPLLQRSLDLALARGLHAHAWRVQTSVADWMLAAGQPAQARRAALELLARMGAQGPQQTTIRAHDTAYRACRALGLHQDALHHLETAERLERSRTTSQLRAQSQLFVTRTEAQRAGEQAERARADALRQRERAAEFAEAAERDPLTGLGNRRHLQRRCAELLPQAAQDGTPLSLALLDLDHFKQVNDRHGHAVGDQLLVALAQLLRENTRAGDVLTRYGGEEFVLVLPGMSLERAHEACERLRERVQALPMPGAAGVPDGPGPTISIGLASAPPCDLPLLLQGADAALYRAKREGRNRVVCGGVPVFR